MKLKLETTNVAPTHIKLRSEINEPTESLHKVDCAEVRNLYVALVKGYVNQAEKIKSLS